MHVEQAYGLSCLCFRTSGRIPSTEEIYVSNFPRNAEIFLNTRPVDVRLLSTSRGIDIVEAHALDMPGLYDPHLSF